MHVVIATQDTPAGSVRAQQYISESLVSVLHLELGLQPNGLPVLVSDSTTTRHGRRRRPEVLTGIAAHISTDLSKDVLTLPKLELGFYHARPKCWQRSKAERACRARRRRRPYLSRVGTRLRDGGLGKASVPYPAA